MSELRKDPIVERWVVMAPERAQRPIEVVDESHAAESPFDPFGEGNESTTTPEVLAFRARGLPANGPGWQVRVVPNMYPAVRRDGSVETLSSGLFESLSGVGAHEVIIECPQNEANLARLSPENIRDVLAAYRDRLVELKRDPRLLHATIFKNQGALAGASVRHSHSQLLATPFIPTSIAEELAGARKYHAATSQNVFATMIEREISDGSRVVLDTPGFLAFCPFASRFSFETWIVPKRSGSHYERIVPELLEELARVLKTVLGKLAVVLDDPSYNYVLHTAPLQEPELPYFYWHFEIYPRLTRIAGFEWGSGCHINEVLPEVAARRLRDVAMV